ncbi:MAG: lysoplasmalogenase [Dermatophilaceae bacterium]
MTTRRRPSLAGALRLTYAALAVADTTLAGVGGHHADRARVVTKSLLMPLLAASFATDARSRRSALRHTTGVAQACAWVGDVALLRTGFVPFATGMGAFAAGHAAYIRGFRAHRRPGRLVADPTVRALAGVYALAGPVMAYGAFRQEPAIGVGVLAYAALLTTTAACAARLDPALGVGARRASLAGALLFLASDTLLGLGQFLLEDPPAALGAAVMATYTAGQYLLAEGALRART